VPEEGVYKAPVPAVSLAVQYAQGVRDLGPGYGVGDEGDAILTVVLPEEAMPAGDEFHVLAHGAVGVAAD
jgi:hypothetical protein